MNTSRNNQRKKRNNRLSTAVLLLALFVILIGIGLAVSAMKIEPSSSEPAAEQKPSKTVITVGNTGDIILHTPIYRTSEYQVDGDYDFSDCFNYVSSAYQAVDYMTVNLETTLPGKTEYLGYPLFRSPDSIAFSLTDAGADLLLLANNHIYDSGKDGFLRTSQFLAEQEIDYTGAQHTSEGKRYLIKDINGVKVGFINYTYETPSAEDAKAVNANPVDASVAPYLNSFKPENLDPFYEEISGVLAEMKDEGVDFTIVYPHWGNEYQLEACSYQQEMAQKLCDMGVDAIIGGHPHVVQPVDVLTSSDGKHKMFCAYSVGNQLSNQRRNLMNLSTGHTEDGLIVNLEITKTSQGKTALTGVEYVPTWVYKSGGGIYYILPLNDIGSLETLTGIDGVTSEAQASYDRTWGIIGDGAQKAADSYGF